MDISIIVPLKDEEMNVKPLYEQVRGVLERMRVSWEILFIDDGSADSTFAQLSSLQVKDTHVRIIKFRKNFGQTAAMDAGFKHAHGDVLIAMDGDLQNDPQDIPRLVDKLKEGYDCVSGWRADRKDPFTKKVISRFGDVVRRVLTGDLVHDSGCTLKAYRRECFTDLDLYGEMHRFIPALLLWKGFKVTELKVKHHPRAHGRSKYNFKRVLKAFLDILVVKFWMQYSARPIHLFGGLGLMSFALGFVSGLYLTYQKFFLHQAIAGRPLLLLTLLLVILGVQFIIFGLMSDILIKIYFGGKNKAYSIEKIVE